MGNNIGAQNTRFGPGSSMAEQAALARETQALVQANQAYSYGDYMRGAEYENAAQKAGMRAERIHARRQRRGYTAAPWAHPQVNTVNPQLSGGSWPINVIGTPVTSLNGPVMTTQLPTMSMMPNGQYGANQFGQFGQFNQFGSGTMIGNTASTFSGPLMLGGSTTPLGTYYDSAVLPSGFGGYGYPAVSPAGGSISTLI